MHWLLRMVTGSTSQKNPPFCILKLPNFYMPCTILCVSQRFKCVHVCALASVPGGTRGTNSSAHEHFVRRRGTLLVSCRPQSHIRVQYLQHIHIYNRTHMYTKHTNKNAWSRHTNTIHNNCGVEAMQENVTNFSRFISTFAVNP